jgi:hypothetical protein
MLHRVVAAIGGLARLSGDRYEPAKYYMRGPGPKTEQAQRSHRVAGRDDVAFEGRSSIASDLHRA